MTFKTRLQIKLSHIAATLECEDHLRNTRAYKATVSGLRALGLALHRIAGEPSESDMDLYDGRGYCQYTD